MKSKFYLFVLIAVSFFVIQCNPVKKTGENEVKVVNNPEQPKEGIYDLAAEELYTLGLQKDNSKYLFTKIRNIDLDKENNLYVLDQKCKIFIFNQEGKYLSQFGRAGNGPGDFGVNTDFAITSDNRIVLADAVNYRYSYYDLKGKYLNFVKAKSFLNNLQLDKNDNIYSRYQDFDSRDVAQKGRPNKTIQYKLIVTVYKHLNNSDVESVVNEFKESEEKITVMNGGVNSDGFINELVWKISPKDFMAAGYAGTYLFSKYSLDGKPISKFGREYSRIANRNEKKVVEDDPYLPVFTNNCLFDQDGNFWVNLDNGEKPEYYIYDVFSEDGVYRKQVHSKYLIKMLKHNLAFALVKGNAGETLIKALKLSFTKLK